MIATRAFRFFPRYERDLAVTLANRLHSDVGVSADVSEAGPLVAVIVPRDLPPAVRESADRVATMVRANAH